MNTSSFNGALSARRLSELKRIFLERSLRELKTNEAISGPGETADSRDRMVQSVCLILHRIHGTALTLGMTELGGKARTWRVRLREMPAAQVLPPEEMEALGVDLDLQTMLEVLIAETATTI